MAISIVQTAQNYATDQSASATVTVTLGQATQAGNCLVVVVATAYETTNATVSGVTLGGAAGNFGALYHIGTGSSDSIVSFWADPDCAGSQTSVAASVSGGSGYGLVAVSVLEVSGLASTLAGLLDQSAGAEGAGTAWSSGPTGTTSHADELAVGGIATYAYHTITGPASPWVNLAQQSGSVSAFPPSQSMAGYDVLSATGTVTYSGFLSGSYAWVAGVVTLKGASSAVSGSGAVALAPLAAAGAGAENIGAAGSAALAPMHASGTGTQQSAGFTGSGSMPLAGMRASGTGAENIGAAGTMPLAPMRMAATGGGGDVTATGSMPLAAMRASGTGAEHFAATGSMPLAPMAMHGTAGENTSATGSMPLAAMRASGTGAEDIPATGSMPLAPMRMHGTSAEQITAAGTAALAPMRMAAAGTGGDVTATGTMPLAGMRTSGHSGETIGATGSMPLAGMRTSGHSGETVGATGSMSLAPVTASGAGAITYSVTYTTAGTHSWTAPSGVTSVTAQAWGAGAAGGGGSGGGAGGGGGGGEYASASVAVTAGNSYTATVGAGGTVPASGTGGSGGSSSFTGDTAGVTAHGGAGGTATAGGAGGTGSTSAVHFDGGSGGGPGGSSPEGGGGGGSSAGTAAAGGSGGTGGSTNNGGVAPAGGGDGGAGSSGTAAGAGHAPGGAGGGSSNSGTGSAGKGADGQVTLTYEIVQAAITGAGTIPLAPLRTSGTGTAPFTGTAAMPLAPMRLSGTASGGDLTAAGTMPLAPMRMHGAGAVRTAITGTAAMPLAPMTSRGTGTIPVTATGSAALAPMRISGSGSETGGAITGAGAIPLAPLRASGTGSVPLTAAGSMPLAPMRTSGSITVPVIELISVTTASASTATIPATTAGNCLIVVITTSSASGASVSGITLGGAAGNFAQAAHAHAIVPGFDALDVFIWADADITGGHTTVVVSGTGLNLSSNGGSLTIYEVAGLSQSPAEVVDQVSTGSATSGATWSSGSTPQTAQAAEFWVGAAVTGEFISVPGTPWTEDNAQSTASAGHQITTATGKAVYSGTQFESSLWSAAVVTFGTRAPAITGTGSLALAPLGMTGVQSLRAAGTLPLAAPGVAGTAVVTNPAPASGASAVPGIAIPGASVPGTPYRVVTPATAGGSAGLAPMAPAGSGTVAYHGTTVLAQWTGSRAIGDGSGIPAPPTMPLEVPVANSGTSGNGMVAFVSWTLPPGYPGADMAVTDDAHNVWWPLGAPATTSDPSGVTRSAIWACASPFAAAHVYVSPTGLPAPCYPAVIGVTIAEFTGFPASVMDATVTTGSANDATAVTADAAAPASAALILATGATSAWAGAPVQPSLTGTGWNALTGISATGGQTLGGVPEHALGTTPAWQTASGARDATWTAATAGGMSAATAVILTSAEPPAEQDGPEVYWPGWLVLAGIGSGALTPPGQVTWTDLTSRWITAGTSSAQTGKQYELDQLQAADDQITLDDNDGYLTPDNPLSPYYPDVTADVPIRILAWKNGRAYGYLAGYAERWPVNWDASWYGLVKPTLTDAWALQQNQLNSVLSQETTWDPNLYAYWPCSDPQYSISVTPTLAAQNLAPGNTNPLVVVTSKNGALAATQAFGAGGGSLPGDQSGSFWSQTGLTAADDGYGYALYCADDGYPPLSGEGMTVSAWFSPDPGGTPGTNPVQIEGSFDQQLIMLRAVNAGAGAVFQVYLQSPIGTSPGAITVAVWDASSRVRTNTAVYTGNWLQAGFLHMAITVTQTTWVLWINGARAGNGSCNLPEQVSWLEFMGSADRNYTGGMLNGQCGEISVYGCQLPADRIRSLYLAGSPNPQTVAGGKTQGFTGNQFATEYAHQRMERLWAYGGWAGPRSVSQSSTTGMEAITDIQGSTAAITAGGGVNLSAGGMQASMAVSNIVFSDGGFIYTDGCGTLCYYSRTDLYQTPNSWTLGEDTAAGEIPYLPSAILGYDKSLLYNGAELTPAASVTGAAITAANTPSIAAHGEFVYNAMAYQYLKALITDQANWIVNTRGTVTLRVQSLTCDAFANEDVWPLLLGIEPAQAVTVWRRPQEAPYTVELFPLVCQLTKTINFGSGTAKVKITTDMFPESTVMIIGDPVRGQATGANVLGW